MIWSLSLPQIAATLAAALVAFQTKNGAGVRLIDEPGINTVLVMVVVTSIQGPIACAEDIDYTPRGSIIACAVRRETYGRGA